MSRLVPLALVLLLSLPVLAEEDTKAPPTPVEVARAFVHHLATDDLPAAGAMLDATMTHALPPGRLRGIWQQIVGRVGAWESTGEATERAIGPHRIVDAETTFQRAVLTLRVTVDGKGKVAGFFLVGERPRADDPSAITLDTGTGVLAGTLDRPDAEEPWPVALVIAGSGPTDRDGNSQGLNNDHLKLLGRGLAKRGIAVVRYDKRGVGGSATAGKREQDLRFETLADDAARWITKLRADERFERVIVVGHSEGSLLGMLAAQKTKPDAFVSIAGPGRPAGALLLEQLKPKLTPELFAQAEAIVTALGQGKTVADVPAAIAPLFRVSVQPYLISWFAYDPAEELGKLEMPVLVVQGTTDIQVAEADARRLVEAHPDAELRLLRGMNHVLKAAESAAEQQRAYADPSVPVVPALLETLTAFVRGKSGPESEGPDGR